MRAPATLQEAQAYIGQTILKRFSIDHKDYKGTIQDVDTEVETDDGLQQGLFYRVVYEDDDEEHLAWDELSKWLANAKKKLKGQGAGSGAADVAAVNDGTSNKRQRRSAGSEHHIDTTPAQQGTAAADSEQYEQPSTGGARQTAGSKRRRAGATQQQQEVKPEEEESPVPVPASTPGSSRKNPRKPAKPRMAVISPPQEQLQTQPQQKRQRRQSKAAAAAAADSEQEEEEEDAVEDVEAGGSKDYAPKQQQHRKQPKQQQASKKARGSGQQQQQAAEADADMGDADAGEEQEEAPEGDEELEREVLRDHAAWEAQQARPKQFVVRRQGTAGHIKHVQVINFMCHHNFAMDFGTHVNVISGRNGSGKSAVLQAMQAALGSKAKDTGRGDNFRELVRTGCHEARVKVTLWNTGEDAFQHSTYGDWITIERVIKTAGGTQYKILNSAGRKVSEGFKNVAALLDHLNVDASNPLAVLTQDTARNFLCGTVADKKKYEIFMKATCLQTMYDNLVKALGTVEEMKEAFKAVREEHDARKAKVDDLRSKLQKLQESASLVEQCTLFERAALWAQVKKQQADLDGLKFKLEVKAPEVQAKHEAALAAANTDLVEIRRKEEQELAAQKAEQDETRTFADAMSALAAELKQAKAATRGKQAAAKKLESKLQQLHADMKNIMEAKRETNDDRQREFEERLQKHQAEMAQAREALATAEAQLGSCQEEREGMRTAIQNKDEEVKQLSRGVQSEQQTLANLQQHLQQLQQAKGQKLAMFGAHAKLRRIVDQKIRQFSKPPIGPVGAHLTLTDTKWAVAGEVVLGSTLEVWIVDNARDNNTLRTLARQHGVPRINTLVSSFNRPQYSIPDSKRLRPGWHNMREFIKIDHPDPQAKIIIDNKLMDETRFEVVVVHDDQEKCRDAIYASAAGAIVPKAVHITGQNFSKGKNNTITSSNFRQRGSLRLGASYEDDLAQTQQQLQISQGRLAEAQQKARVANAELQELQKQSNTFSLKEKQALGVKGRAAHRVQILQGQAPKLELDEDDGEDMVADQLRQLQEVLTDVQQKYDRAEMELNEARLNEQKAKKLHEDRQSEMQQTLTQMNDRTEALDRLATQKEAASAAKADAEGKLEGFAKQMGVLQAGVAKLVTVVEQYREAGLKMCTEEQGWAALDKGCEMLKAEIHAKLKKQMKERWRRGQIRYDDEAAFEVAVEETAQGFLDKALGSEDGGAGMFQKKAVLLEKHVAEAEREAGGNKDELELTLRRAEAEYNRNDTAVYNMRTVVGMCAWAVDDRWRKYDTLFDHVLRTVSSKFMGYMYRRGHQGQVLVNQETGELKLLVKINAKAQGAEAKKSKAVKDLKQLSGGERSFTTVAFILALGKWTESPFRAMDEYDVFMDAVNRRIATQTLLEFALEEDGLQFVLLTPQDLQAVDDAKQHLATSKGQAIPEGFVKVVQMRPAREGGQQHH